MKPHPLTYLSLGISLCSIGYAAWLHVNHLSADRLAMNALRQRERELVEKFAPRMEDVYRDMIPHRKPPNATPTTLEELIDPLIGLMESVGDTGETTNSAPDPK
jgi:hypothetical protein